MKPISLLIILVTIFFVNITFSQSIQGYVYDEENNPIPYARIFVKNYSNLGAITDEDGKYFFGCDQGTYEVIYKSIGFEDQTVQVTVRGFEPTINNVWMVQENNQLGTVDVTTKKRNVGWELTQQVINHKKEFIQQFDSYSCDVYIKGVETFDLKKKPEKVDEEMEEDEPKDLFQKQKDEINNTINGDDRLNLIEINLTKHYQYPNNVKEVKTGYEKIGRPKQIYFQSTVNGEFNFYKSLIRKEDLHATPIVSPLHPSGILSYHYKLKEVITHGNDTIYRVHISPRSVGTSTLEGDIFILKNEWVLTKVDLSMHKGNLKIYDDFRIIQTYQKLDTFWVVKSQQFEYKTKYGKETISGSTMVSYSNYIINPTFPPKFFGNEIGTTIKEAYERDSSYWEQIRPIPLTAEEQRKKFVQDSLTAIYTSEKYLDSIDAVFNEITFLKVAWFGVQHRNRDKKTQWWLSSVVDLYEPIGVGGMRIGPGFNLFKKWENQQWIDFDGDVTIGFNNADLRGSLRLYHLYNPKKFGMWMIWGNRGVSYINPNNSWLEVWKRSNTYLNTQGGLWHRIELVNGLFITTGVRMERRSSFDTTYQFVTWLDDEFENDMPIQFDAYYAVRSNIGLSYTPGQKYVTEPNRKIILGSLWPTFSVYWEKGYKGPFGSDVDFDYLSFRVEQEFQIGTMGKSKYIAKTGKFVNQDSVFYIDRKFFRKSDDSWLGWLFSQPLYSFQNLDSSFQTKDYYLEFHYIHHFNGSIINKIPFMKKTGIKALAGSGFLYLPEYNNYFYTEAYFGVERIFKFLRKRLRIGGYMIFSWANTKFSLPDVNQQKNVQFKISFDVMNERDLKFNF